MAQAMTSCGSIGGATGSPRLDHDPTCREKTHGLRLALQIPNGIGCFIFLESLMVEIEFNLANGIAAERHGAEGGAWP